MMSNTSPFSLTKKSSSVSSSSDILKISLIDVSQMPEKRVSGGIK